MPAKRLVYARLDGGISVVIPDPGCRRPGQSVADWLAHVAARSIPPGTDFAVLDAETLPSRRFRGAWRRSGAAVLVDPPSARAQLLAEIRDERNRRLLASDSERARLEEIGTLEQRQALAALRQALRDLPAAVEAEIAALDVPALETYQPTWPT